MIKKTVIETYCEPCNCGLQIRHHNGGNYHTIERLHIISDDNAIVCKILEKTTTREDFPGDKYEILTFQGGVFRLEDEEWLEDEVNVVHIEGFALRFRQGEAEIVWQNPEVFIEARRPHAEALASMARAFGHDVKWEDFILA